MLLEQKVLTYKGRVVFEKILLVASAETHTGAKAGGIAKTVRFEPLTSSSLYAAERTERNKRSRPTEVSTT